MRTTIAETINIIFYAYELLIVIRALLSWFPLEPGLERHPLMTLLTSVTDPLILICREILYSMYRLLNVEERHIPVDFSPLLALGIIHFARMFIVALF